MGWRTSDHKRGREIHFSVEKSFNHTARGERTPDCVCGSHPWWDKAEDNDDFSFIRKENFPSLSVEGRIIQFSLDARSQQRCSRAVFFFLFNVTVRGWEVFLGSQGFRSRQSFSLTSHFFTLSLRSLGRCTNAEFQCSDEACISLAHKCDGEPDCDDGSDEANCEHSVLTCPAGEFKCRGSRGLPNNGRCMLDRYKCDGDNDCGDWSDEVKAIISRLVSEKLTKLVHAFHPTGQLPQEDPKLHCQRVQMRRRTMHFPALALRPGTGLRLGRGREGLQRHWQQST